MKAKSKSRQRAPQKRDRERSLPEARPAREFEEKFAHGLSHFNSRRFFEAHEAWEEIWLKSHGAERRRLQGIIQIAAAFHHHSRENLAGTESLLRAGLLKIEDAPSGHWGLQIDELRGAVMHWLSLLEAKRRVAGKKPPKLRHKRQL